ncbi:MAG: T9SS type A sorting domain-containing protein [Ignavibacteria bacterium]|nr:T9SS type A sorting domain-containing protein [Ignavibacteria bacterium]MBT8382880.1 T9SS type A sorting domain-containing protein [Ignavibacteria bacterium]MBT8390456.1 T9SS type A sorting domain-containing protein [Ignavibacteria bacterium]NNJ52932.1 T9SS type A sorting domain-containing protein [Ignavibacteriaceae bacterium]NNL21367.1 T9SS type A sorting domain-containing protein [Ignavibacteriaceae bacterium]
MNLNETKNFPQTITLDPIWDADSLNIVVFVQSTGSKTIYQSETISYSDLIVTSADNNNQITDEFILEQNYPNPFNPTTKINFAIPQSGVTTIKVYNILGNEVATLLDRELTAGKHDVNFDATNLSSGTYFYTLTSGTFRETKKLVLLK